MNIIYFDFAAIVLTLIMFILNWVQGLTKGRTNLMFMLMTIAAFLSALGDYLAGYGSNYYMASELNKNLIYFYNYLYFFAHNNVTYIFFLYCFSSMGIWHKVMNGKVVKWIMLLCCVVTNILFMANFFNHMMFYIDDNMKYVRGDYMMVLYVLTFVSMLIGMTIVVRNKNSVSFDKFVVLALMVPLNVAAIAVQFVNGSILIETYALAVEIAIMVLVIQRQDEGVDPITGAKKNNMAMAELKSKFITGAPFSVTFIKIKNEKSIRVYLGQDEYNKFLNEVTKRINAIEKSIKFSGAVYYLEYGLYAVIAEHNKDDLLKQFAEKVSDKLSDVVRTGDSEINIDGTVCVVKCPEDISEYTTFMTFASNFHQSLPENKKTHYYSDYVNDSEFIIRNQLGEIIKRSLKENQFEVYYQPIYSVAEEKYVAVEALVRLKDRKYGNISPAQFIPVAEQTGDVHAIGAYVLEEVCKFIAENNIEEYGIKQVQINLSASQCVEMDLPDKVFTVVNKYKINPSLISFEISESTADIDQAMVDSNIATLNEKGFHFALDDYGTGYSNVKRVTSLPISLIKLGRKFVNELEDESMRIIINDTIKMFKAIGMKVLVEGIENKDKADYFKSLGCDYIQGSEYLQGFYFCKPVSAKALIEFMNNNNTKH